jgi:hypothetical protein
MFGPLHPHFMKIRKVCGMQTEKSRENVGGQILEGVQLVSLSVRDSRWTRLKAYDWHDSDVAVAVKRQGIHHQERERLEPVSLEPFHRRNSQLRGHAILCLRR